MSHNNTVTAFGLEEGCSISDRDKDFSRRHHVQTDYGNFRFSSHMSTGGSVPAYYKAAEA